MKFSKEEIYGFSGSAIFCMLLLLLLTFIVLKTQIKEGEEGILVNFGNVDSASGTFEPRYMGENRNVSQEDVEVPPVSGHQPTQSNTEVLTQNTEETVSIPDARKKEEERKREEALRVETERRRQAEDEQRKRQQAINSQVSGAFGVGTTSGSGSQGTAATGSGNQGSPQGNAATGPYTGVGGFGEFALSGRSIGSGGLPRPAYSVQEEGKIVIDITVDPKGNVIFAEIGKGTNIDNVTMRKAALEAAKKAKFNTITERNNQSGTITYKYSLK